MKSTEASSISSKKVFALLFVFLFIISLAGCGGGGGNGPTPASGNPNSGGGTGETGGSGDTEGGGSATGVASLTWIAPTTNSNGSQLTDLAGFRVHYGTASRTYTHVIDVQNVTSYAVNNLPAGTYYFAVTAYNSLGNDSDFSNEVSRTVP